MADFVQPANASLFNSLQGNVSKLGESGGLVPIVVYDLTSLAGLVVASLVLTILLGKTFRKKRCETTTKSYYTYLVALAFADFCKDFASFISTSRQLLVVAMPDVFPAPSYLEITLYTIITITAIGQQTFVIFLISIDRIIAITCPLKFASSYSDKNYPIYACTLPVSCLFVILAISTEVATAQGKSELSVARKSRLGYFDGEEVPQYMMIFVDIYHCLVVLVLASYMVLLAIVYKQGRLKVAPEGELGGASNSITQSRNRREARITQTVGKILTFFAVTVFASDFAGVVVFYILHADGDTIAVVAIWSGVVMAMSTVVNLFVYYWKNQEVRRGIRSLFRKHCLCTPSYPH